MASLRVLRRDEEEEEKEEDPMEQGQFLRLRARLRVLRTKRGDHSQATRLPRSLQGAPSQFLRVLRSQYGGPNQFLRVLRSPQFLREGCQISFIACLFFP